VDNPAIKAKFDAWFLHLPQVLWEIGSNNLLSTEVSIRQKYLHSSLFICTPCLLGHLAHPVTSVAALPEENPVPGKRRSIHDGLTLLADAHIAYRLLRRFNLDLFHTST